MLLLVLVVTKTKTTEYCWSIPFLGKRCILRCSHISDYKPLHAQLGAMSISIELSIV